MNAGETENRDRIVATLREMEAGGYHFDLNEDGEPAFRYETPAPDAHGERPRRLFCRPPRHRL